MRRSCEAFALLISSHACRNAKRKELDEIKAVMVELNDDLAKLRSAHTPQVPWTFALIFLVFFAFLMYKMWTNPIGSFATDDRDPDSQTAGSEHAEL